MMASPAYAGFPSPAQDEAMEQLDIGQLLVERPATTFFWRVEGCSMDGFGIHHGDYLVVDRAVPAADGSVVIAILNGGFVVKQLVRRRGVVVLRSAHPDYPEIRITEEQDLAIWGVVRWSVHRVPNGISR
ncbi:MAG: translesion error-prone DNA polymerase V autoproteolytic subunit [Magnetococcales bacterium]|nr:translesion error-prone DNA polymerase V autoproteolytic subunit [Magnetococcales bacterium]MBF0583613.1 translesion error-prone DNA polymerase V autoproteolytic subunit [Magnetococcales bacterium]